MNLNPLLPEFWPYFRVTEDWDFGFEFNFFSNISFPQACNESFSFIETSFFLMKY